MPVSPTSLYGYAPRASLLGDADDVWADQFGAGAGATDPPRRRRRRGASTPAATTPASGTGGGASGGDGGTGSAPAPRPPTAAELRQTALGVIDGALNATPQPGITRADLLWSTEAPTPERVAADAAAGRFTYYAPSTETFREEAIQRDRTQELAALQALQDARLGALHGISEQARENARLANRRMLLQAIGTSGFKALTGAGTQTTTAEAMRLAHEAELRAQQIEAEMPLRRAELEKGGALDRARLVEGDAHQYRVDTQAANRGNAERQRAANEAQRTSVNAFTELGRSVTEAEAARAQAARELQLRGAGAAVDLFHSDRTFDETTRSNRVSEAQRAAQLALQQREAAAQDLARRQALTFKIADLVTSDPSTVLALASMDPNLVPREAVALAQVRAQGLAQTGNYGDALGGALATYDAVVASGAGGTKWVASLNGRLAGARAGMETRMAQLKPLVEARRATPAQMREYGVLLNTVKSLDTVYADATEVAEAAPLFDMLRTLYAQTPRTAAPAASNPVVAAPRLPAAPSAADSLRRPTGAPPSYQSTRDLALSPLLNGL